MESDGGDAALPTRRPKWEVYTDESGNMYFYNTVTGETAWELPENDVSEEEDDDNRDEDDGSVQVTAMGETIVRNQMRDDAGNILELTVVRPKYSQFEIAVEVIETMLTLLDETESIEETLSNSKKKVKRFVSPAAEARAKKNEANLAKRRKRERLLAMTRYMNVLIPPVMTASAMEASVLGGKQPVGTLFSREDAKKWRVEKEVQQIRQRYKTRKNNVKHHEQVLTRAAHHQFLKSFRTDLLNHFIAQIPYSSELQQQRILLMTSPQQLAEMELQRKATLEPEMLERYEAEQRLSRETSSKSLQKVFVLADRGAVGSLHLLQTLVTMFSDERAQKYALKVRGLAEILQNAEIQRFVVDYVSNHQPRECQLSLPQFEEFVQTIEDVVEHYTSLKMAVQEAESEIAAAIEDAGAKGSSGAGSLLRARLNMVSKKKVEQEMAALKATQQGLEAKIKLEARAPYSDTGDDNLALMMAKEEWEMYHQHRYIQVHESLPGYCCLCRRRKWELWRQELETAESEYRSTYSNRYALKIKSEELRLIREANGEEASAEDHEQEHGGSETANCAEPSPTSGEKEALAATSPMTSSLDDLKPLDDDEVIVLQVIRTLLLMTERIHSEDAVKSPPPRVEHRRVVAPRQQQTGSPRKKKAKKNDGKKRKNSTGGKEEKEEEELDELQLAMKIFETENRERNLKKVEDTSMHIYLERNRRLIERPLLQHQDVAYNAYIRLLTHCVNPSSLLYRLRFERCLSFEPPQHLVLHVSDGASSDGSCILPSRQLVLQAVPCRTETEASFVFYEVQQMQTKLKSPFVVGIASCAKHTYQFFAESGLLVECWPVVFVVIEYFPHGTWQYAFTHAVETQTIQEFGEAEAVIIRVFRDVAAGLAAMHSSGILHLNTNLGNLFIAEPAVQTEGDDQQTERLQHLYNVRLGGMLACKRGFDEGQLRRGDMVHCLNAATTPPEAVSGQPVSGKADVWMVGCALWEALMIWQRHQLRGRGHIQALPTTNTVIRLKTIPDLLQEIPLATSAAIRSLLRMLLQPNPSQRPQMSQVVDILSFTSRKPSTTNH